MPIIQGIRRVSPLDINKNVRIGVAFPLDEVNMFKGTVTTKEQAKSNLINVLLTEPGERVNHPNFGVGLKNKLFENDPDIDELNDRIHSQINIYIPSINLIDTELSFSGDDHKLFIKITYSYLFDGQKDAIQLNFNSPTY